METSVQRCCGPVFRIFPWWDWPGQSKETTQASTNQRPRPLELGSVSLSPLVLVYSRPTKDGNGRQGQGRKSRIGMSARDCGGLQYSTEHRMNMRFGSSSSLYLSCPNWLNLNASLGSQVRQITRLSPHGCHHGTATVLSHSCIRR